MINTKYISLIITLIYAISFFGFFGRNEWMTILGGMAMVALGVYMISQGLLIYRDWITNYLSYITIGLGAFFAIVAAISVIEESLG